MTKAILLSPRLDLLLRLLLAGVFVYAAIPKLAAPSDFAVVIAGYGLAPAWLVPTLAVALPLAELVVAALLVLDRKGGISGAVVLLLFFVLVLVWGIHMGLDVDCGCFGPDDPEAQAYHGLREALMRDLLMLACCGWLTARRYYMEKTKSFRLEPVWRRRRML